MFANCLENRLLIDTAMKKSVTILELRQLVRSVIVELGPVVTQSPATQRAPSSHAMQQAKTEPASGVHNVDPSERALAQANLQGNNPNAQRASAIVKILADRGEILAPEAIQTWLKSQDPAEVFGKTTQALADEYSHGGTPSTTPAVGTPQLKQGDFDREQNNKSRQQALFDKYSTPRENFK